MNLNIITFFNNFRRLTIAILLVLGSLYLVKGQELKSDSISLENNASIDTSNYISDNSYMNFDITYTNNKINSQREPIKNVPGFLGGISYNNKVGFYADASVINYYDATISTYDYNLTLGFQKDFKNIVDIDLYYDYHGFKGDTLYRGINYNQVAGLSLGLKLKSINLFADGYYYFGKTENYFIDIGILAFEQFDELFFKTDYILIQPSISAALGTDYWLYENMRPVRKQYVLYILNNRGFTTEEFDYQGLDIMLPISYGIGDVSLMFAWTYYIPSDKFKFLGWTNQSGYMISLSYTLNFY